MIRYSYVSRKATWLEEIRWKEMIEWLEVEIVTWKPQNSFIIFNMNADHILRAFNDLSPELW